jgi:hypothetical protein
MSKTVKRVILDDIWAIGRNESWFSDMAKLGLHLQKIRGGFAHFEKGEPKDIKYRIDVLKHAPTIDQLDFYQDCGWTLAAVYKNFYIFSSPEDSGSPELHTDPAEQSYTLGDLDRLLKRNVVIVIFAVLLMAAMILGMYLISEWPVLLMVEGDILQQTLLLTVELYVCFTVIRNYFAVRTLKQALSEGRSINHKEDWKKARLMNGGISALFLLTAVLCIILPIYDMVAWKEVALPEEAVNLQVVRLAEIEDDPRLTRDEYITEDGLDFNNQVVYDWSPLAPVQHEVREHGLMKGEMWEDLSGEYSPSITSKYYRLLIPKMAESLLQDLTQRYVYDPDDVVREAVFKGFDKVYISEKNQMTQVFAIRGREVFYFRYIGWKTAEDILPLLENKKN